MEDVKIEIVENPAGYSDGTYGYVITAAVNGDELQWRDGGYHSRQLALSAANARSLRLRVAS